MKKFYYNDNDNEAANNEVPLWLAVMCQIQIQAS